MDFIYNHLKSLHSLLMKNKHYFWYRHIKWNYGGIIKYIKSIERDKKWYSDRYCNCWLKK